MANVNIMSRMTGEELLLMRILNGARVQPAVDAELDRRARFGVSVRTAGKNRRAGRTGAVMHSARQAA